jgi:hypothetical protein
MTREIPAAPDDLPSRVLPGDLPLIKSHARAGPPHLDRFQCDIGRRHEQPRIYRVSLMQSSYNSQTVRLEYNQVQRDNNHELSTLVSDVSYLPRIRLLSATVLTSFIALGKLNRHESGASLWLK